MSRLSSKPLRWLLTATLLFLIHGAAYAQATRTWVSGVGDDANPCSRTAPCKTFAGAISKTAAGGEIDTLVHYERCAPGNGADRDARRSRCAT